MKKAGLGILKKAATSKLEGPGQASRRMAVAIIWVVVLILPRLPTWTLFLWPLSVRCVCIRCQVMSLSHCNTADGWSWLWFSLLLCVMPCWIVLIRWKYLGKNSDLIWYNATDAAWGSQENVTEISNMRTSHPLPECGDTYFPAHDDSNWYSKPPSG